MQPGKTTPTKKIKFLDTKVFIATLSIAVTLGLWNLFSNEAVQAEKVSPTAVVNVPPQTPANAAQGYPPLPTLVPLAEISTQQLADGQTTNQGQESDQTNGLRAVAVPTLTIVQKSKPVFEQSGGVTVISVRGGGGGGSVTTTRSSGK